MLRPLAASLLSLSIACHAQADAQATHVRVAPRPVSEAAELAVQESERSSSPAALPITAPAGVSFTVGIEDASGRALNRFFAALSRAAEQRGQARVVVYGDSHTDTDVFTGRMRELLQQRFGDAGPGFVLPAKPWRWYRNARIEHLSASGFEGKRVRGLKGTAGRYGFAGVLLEAKGPSMARLRTRGSPSSAGHASRLSLLYANAPGGGHLRVSVDGVLVGTLDTNANRESPTSFEFSTNDAPHEIELEALGDGPITLFGMALERTTPGVVLDTLGIPGARARNQLLWDDQAYAAQLRGRAPDLVVLAYGTNEAGDVTVPVGEYARELHQVVSRVRATVPDASCVLVGPTDRVERQKDRSFVPLARVAQIVSVQRQVAVEHGCGFFDTVAFMGGPGAMVQWVRAEPALGAPDYVHLTRAGYETLGTALYEALVRGFVPTGISAGAFAPKVAGPAGH